MYNNRTIPESPRWLLVSGNEQDAISVLTSIAKGNGADMPTNCELKKNSVGAEGGQEGASIRDLFTGRNIRHRTFILCIAW